MYSPSFKSSGETSLVSRFGKTTILAAALAVFAGPATAQRPLGIDVSQIQPNINWSSVKSSGVSFAWAKAAEGTATDGWIGEDSSWVYNATHAPAAGVYLGGYYYCHPETDPGSSGADAEAAFFWSVAGGYISNNGLSLNPMLDFEQNVTGAGYTASSLSAWANEWCQDIVNDGAANGVLINPTLYTFISYANGEGGYGPGFDDTIEQWPLDMANVNTPQDPFNPQVGGPAATYPWAIWTYWQYNWWGTVPGVAQEVDQDVFNGTSAELVSMGVVPFHINPCVARTSDGRLNLFAVGNTGYLYENYQTNAGAGWSGWIALGTTNNVWSQNCMPAVGTNSDGRLEMFIVGTDGSVNHIYQKVAGSSKTTNWSAFSIVSSSHVNQIAKLAVYPWANGKLDLFVIGTDGVMYHNYQTGSGWSGFQSLGGSWTQNADVAVNRDLNGEVEVMVIGKSGNLYNNWQTSSNGTNWHGWNSLGGVLPQGARTALGRNSDGRLEVFTIGSDGVSYHNWETAANGQTTWNGWASLGGSWEVNSKTLVSSDANGALEVFLIGNTGNMYHNYESSGGWSGWVDLNGTFTQNISPCVGQNASGTLEVFLNFSKGTMEHAYETSPNSTTWASWSSLGGTWD